MGVVIDAHIHLFSKGDLPAVWYQRGAERWAAATWPNRDPSSLDIESGLLDPEAELLIPELDKARIDAALCMTLDWGIGLGEEPPVPVADVHAHYGELQGRFPGRFFAAAGIDPRRADACHLLEDAVRRHGLKALKLYPPCGYLPSDPTCRPLYEKCLELGIPVVVHTAFIGFPHVGHYANPLGIVDVQVMYPDLPIVLAHSGYSIWAEEAIEVAAHHTRTYLELSNWNWDMDRDPEGVVRHLIRMRDAVGAHRILYASDHLGGRRFSGERSKLARWVDFIRGLPEAAAKLGSSFSHEEMELILGENARRVFQLPVDGGKAV